MDLASLANFAEIIGTLMVVLSLIYVGGTGVFPA